MCRAYLSFTLATSDSADFKRSCGFEQLFALSSRSGMPIRTRKEIIRRKCLSNGEKNTNERKTVFSLYWTGVIIGQISNGFRANKPEFFKNSGNISAPWMHGMPARGLLHFFPYTLPCNTGCAWLHMQTLPMVLWEKCHFFYIAQVRDISFQNVYRSRYSSSIYFIGHHTRSAMVKSRSLFLRSNFFFFEEIFYHVIRA